MFIPGLNSPCSRTPSNTCKWPIPGKSHVFEVIADNLSIPEIMILMYEAVIKGLKLCMSDHFNCDRFNVRKSGNIEYMVAEGRKKEMYRPVPMNELKQFLFPEDDIADLRAAIQMGIGIKVFRMNRLGIPQDRIAKRLGLIRTSLHNHLSKMSKLPNSTNTDLYQGFTVPHVAEKHGWTEPRKYLIS